jgi:predicted O-methyltransferase YrrM
MTTNADDAIAIQRSYYTQTAARYEEMHGSEGSGDPFQMDFVVAMLRMLQIKSLLDVGTASGRTLRTLKTAIRRGRNAASRKKSRDPRGL